jgi:hypothetical protein
MADTPGGAASRSEHRTQQRSMVGVAGILCLAALLAMTGYWLGREPPLRYEQQGENHFEPAEATPGQKIALYFRLIRWNRVCRAVIHERVKCVDPHPPKTARVSVDSQHQVDVGVRTITLPAGPVVLENKSRDFFVPPADQCAPGPAAYTATFEAICTPPDKWWPYRVNVEPIPFTVR